MSPLRSLSRRALVVLTVVALAVGIVVPALAVAQETDERVVDPSSDERVVDILQLEGPLTPPTVRALHRALEDAERRQVELLVVELDAPGAIAVDAHALVAPFAASAVPVVVWAGPHTARVEGAGALLLATSHLPAASRFALVGPACPLVVEEACSGDDHSLIAAYLDTHGADLDLAGATFSGEEAREAGLVGLLSEGLVPLLEELDGREVTTATGTRTLDLRPEGLTVRFANLGLLERILDATLDPSLFYLILLSVLFLLAFEVFQPGFGVAGIAALVILPLAVYGLVVLPVAWWAVALVVAGMALLAVDLAIAGLGVPTAAGAASLAAGSWWLFTPDHPLMALPVWLVVLAVGFAVVYFVVIMTVVLRAQVGPEIGEVGEDLVGAVGVVRSTMNPEGHVFVAGALWRARWTGEARGKIKTGTRVRVTGMEEGVLLVDDAVVVSDGAAGDGDGRVGATDGT